MEVELPDAGIGTDADCGWVRITLACSSGAGAATERRLRMPAGATLADALRHAGLSETDDLIASGSTGIWGRQRPVGTQLADGDRVELYRPLLVDPKVARRERFRQQGARATGLFARQRANGKAGY